jgi:hypothetical protein
MNIQEVAKGMEQGKCYTLPDWQGFYMYNIPGESGLICIKSKHTEGIEYNLHISELLTEEWTEVEVK